MSIFTFDSLNDVALAIIVGILFLAQFALFFIVGCLIIVPVWLVSLWHSPLLHHSSMG